MLPGLLVYDPFPSDKGSFNPFPTSFPTDAAPPHDASLVTAMSVAIQSVYSSRLPMWITHLIHSGLEWINAPVVAAS